MRSSSPLILAFAAAAAMCVTAPAYSQDTDTATPRPAPAHVTYVEGSATIEHADRESEPAVINLPVVPGDRIRTMARSRVEVMFPDGSGIMIDADSDVEFLTTTRVRVAAGTIEHLQAPPPNPQSPSVQNLPPDLQTYGPDLDQNGSWQNDPQYGSVWYPSSVGPDWRPYYDGYWATVPAYGYTWIGYNRWAWPTHHYGRWGYAHSRWFWIPGPSYASAWVSWGTAPGYVGWCPLGWNGRPVVSLSAGLHNSWNAWTVVDRQHFGGRAYSARRYGIEPQRLASSTAFIEHRNAPAREPRGTFSVGPSPAANVAVPRITHPASPAVVVPSDQQPGRRRSPDASPANADRVGNPGDHPAYRPRYEPRERGTEVAPVAPRSDPRPEPSYRDRRMNGGESRGTVQESRPAQGPRAEPRETAPRARETPAHSAGESHPARTERGGSAGGETAAASPRARSGDGAQSTGTAVRRPR